MAYEFQVWGSHKDLGNDDHLTGDKAETLELARIELEALLSKPWVRRSNWAYACIEGPDGRVFEQTNPSHREDVEDDSADRSEAAMMAGMSHGVQGYNEALGFDVETEEEAPRRSR